ncbi:hypothetical protein HZZ00_11240 [Streptomyces sp. NEAU-sy36]|uniref:hypothetical protein n=1 Tax=unclassified Streptomyces TaxID=2593676 RepID=UPI0015D5E855|nr:MULTISPECIES: hypothetical protein [unclassified Streptomyces]QLJ01543.1 hypothetical protein HZZ00_11240 [Streptomyces sp. NEAU-sy36]
MANSNSRKPRTAARSASRPSGPRGASERYVEEPEISEAEAQEAEAGDQYVTAELCGEQVQIVPPAVWRTSWSRMLNQGDLDGFAQAVLHPDDYELYLDLDPTITEFLAFTEDAGRRSGESLGKSRGPAPSSRRMRRR